MVLIDPVFSISFPGLPFHPYHFFPSPQFDHTSGTCESGSGYNHCPWLTLIFQAEKFFDLDPTNSFKRSDKSLQSIIKNILEKMWWFYVVQIHFNVLLKTLYSINITSTYYTHHNHIPFDQKYIEGQIQFLDSLWIKYMFDDLGQMKTKYILQ